MGHLYLACPYSHTNSAERERRFRTVCRAAAKLMQAGIVVFSPLSHSVPIVEHGGLGEMTHEFWMSQDIPFLQRCDELLVIGLEGWEDSLGVREEMFQAMALRKPITVIGEADIDRLPFIPKATRRFLQSNILTKEVKNA